MDNVCSYVGASLDGFIIKDSLTNETEVPQNTSHAYSDYSTTGFAGLNASSSDSPLDLRFYLYGVINPIFCVMGIIGNALNILVLTRRRMQESMDCTMEKAAQTGLVALAASDMLYCITALFNEFFGGNQTLFMGRNIWMFAQIYGNYVQNIFMNSSTWLTVIMAAGRYAAICRPLHARYLVGITATRIAVLSTFLTWILLQLPTVWRHSVAEIECYGQTVYILDEGVFITNLKLRMTFSYLWSVFGYFIPVLILAYCNVHLIKALRESNRMRRLYRVSPRGPSAGSRITPTLVAIVCMFLLLVSPSEILQFFHYTVSGQEFEAFNIALVFSNMLLTVNFAFNFVLYCIVNVHFRETWKEVVFCFVRRKYYGPLRKRKNSASTKASFIGQSTFESMV
ncbi:hypothetical protein CAPTEDRAFT_212238 [Capitella teleta]|uniref:G-protein coupled receptors family 1 profile domain-containing protein n=1 Tax=Capitella teleta TaxID=283909 RepID=R7VG79_CAPTE|nr:hypothetical protein CAPTEDRAFT_212238 [Capitella teleta]|eukprot:ELU17853.1 hypothetical protein CAPTEDRAFT_212238 [Capitella teleta]